MKTITRTPAAARAYDAGWYAARNERMAGCDPLHPAALACYPAAFREGYAAGWDSVALAA